MIKELPRECKGAEKLFPRTMADPGCSMVTPTHTHAGKRLRAEMLVHLRERVGMTYREIAHMDIFADLGMSSLGTIYQRNRKRLQTGRNDPK